MKRLHPMLLGGAAGGNNAQVPAPMQKVAATTAPVRKRPAVQVDGTAYLLGLIGVMVVLPAIPRVGKCARIVSAT